MKGFGATLRPTTASGTVRAQAQCATTVQPSQFMVAAGGIAFARAVQYRARTMALPQLLLSLIVIYGSARLFGELAARLG